MELAGLGQATEPFWVSGLQTSEFPPQRHLPEACNKNNKNHKAAPKNTSQGLWRLQYTSGVK